MSHYTVLTQRANGLTMEKDGHIVAQFTSDGQFQSAEETLSSIPITVGSTLTTDTASVSFEDRGAYTTVVISKITIDGDGAATSFSLNLSGNANFADYAPTEIFTASVPLKNGTTIANGVVSVSTAGVMTFTNGSAFASGTDNCGTAGALSFTWRCTPQF